MEDCEQSKKCRPEVKVEVKEANQDSGREFCEFVKTNWVEKQELFYDTMKQLTQKKSFTMKNIRVKTEEVLTKQDEIFENGEDLIRKIIHKSK